MPNVLNEYAGDGVTQTFNFSMADGYLSRDYVVFQTRPNDSILGYEDYDRSKITWLTDFSVRTAEPVPVGTTFVITRATPASALVNFQNTSRITERNLDTATRQSIHRTVETADYVARGMVGITELAEVAVGASEDSAHASELAASLVLSAEQAAVSAANSASVAKDLAEAATNTADAALQLINEAVKGNVDSFNGRDGVVLPARGDYTPGMVGFEHSGVLTTVAGFSPVPAWSDHMLNAQAQALADRSELLRDNQKRTPMSFATLSEASAAAATLSDGQLVDVESEQKRYRVNSKLLEFVENFLRSDLARAIGASLVGFAKPGGPAQTVQQHIDMLYFGVANIRDPQFAGGAKGTWNGATGDDDTAAIQAALNSGARFIYVPPLGSGFSYRLTSPVTISGNVNVLGAGASPYTKFIGTRGPGSWFHFDHGGRGFVIAGDGLLSGVELGRLGMLRTQPVPAAGWAPADHDYDVYIDNADVLLSDVTLLNPTRGVFLTNGNAGRLEINTLRGHAFNTMLKVELSYDVVKINNLHQWPFWSDNNFVHAYTLQNLDVLYFERADNPMLTNIFTIFARSGMRFGQNSNGKTSKVHLANVDFDRGNIGVWVDSTVTTGVTGQFSNLTYQWETGLLGSKGIFVEGKFSELDFVNTRSDGSSDSAIHVGGSGNKINLSGRTAVKFYGNSVTNATAIYSGSGNLIDIDGYPIIESGAGTGGRYGGGGNIRVDEWRAYNASVSSQVGTIAEISNASCLFKRFGNTVEIALDISILSNGSGSGAVRVTIPTPANANAVGTGRDVNVGGAALTGTIPVGASYIDIRRYDNTYPAANGSRLVMNASYKIA